MTDDATFRRMKSERDVAQAEADRLKQLLRRALSVLSTLEGEESTEQALLDDLTGAIKNSLGITPLVPGGLI